MTRATTTIPFSTIKFIDKVPRLSDLTERLTQKLREIRIELNHREPHRMADGKAQSIYELITDADTARIKRRAMRYLERLHNSTGTKHLPQRDEALLTPSRGGLPVARIVNEHEADEIAAALHAEMPWMTDALLPLLERMTAETWECPYYQIRVDMSWANWVMTANSRWGLPAPLLSRCVVLDLPDLTGSQLQIFVESQGAKRGLPQVAIDATSDALQRATAAGRTPSLRTVSRMLDRVELLAQRPVAQ